MESEKGFNTRLHTAVDTRRERNSGVRIRLRNFSTRSPLSNELFSRCVMRRVGDVGEEAATSSRYVTSFVRATLFSSIPIYTTAQGTRECRDDDLRAAVY